MTESVRRLAHGDLNARPPRDRSLGEASALVEDFNSMAERLQRMTGELVTWNAAIAHELRTPVTILRGRLQGLAEGVFPPDEALFRSLLAQVEGLSRLIEDLRVLSLADSGHLSLRTEIVDLAEEIRATVELVEPDLRAARLVLDVSLPSCQVECDVARIRQVVIACWKTRAAMQSRARCASKPNATARNSHSASRTTGREFPDDVAAHIFEAFVRGDDSARVTVAAAAAWGWPSSAPSSMPTAARSDAPPAAQGARFTFSIPCHR